MKRMLPIALALLVLVAGCTEERRVAEVGDGGRPGASSDYTCLTCHASADSLKAYLAPEGLRLAAAASLAPRGDGAGGEVPALDAWEKFLIAGADGEAFLASTHGRLSCQLCHGGPRDGDFASYDEAHAGVVRDPSADPTACLACHAEPVADLAAVDEAGYRASLHLNQWGYHTAIQGRCPGASEEDYAAGFQADCASCHSTCGECHVSRPRSVGGGFIAVASQRSARHKFQRTPSMTEQCMACHGSRIAHDFLGEAEGNEPDVHAAMHCVECHDAEELHGDRQHSGEHYEHRFQVATMPTCEECHEDAAEQNAFHRQHWSGPGTDLACQVCHSQPYKNCSSCHAGGESQPSTLAFKIGRNPLSDERRYDYAVVRHVPVAEDSYEAWNLTLTDFDALPTWTYSAPHNIKLFTERTTHLEGNTLVPDCKACHNAAEGGEGDPFLRAGDLADGDAAANEDVVVRSGRPFDLD